MAVLLSNFYLGSNRQDFASTNIAHNQALKGLIVRVFLFQRYRIHILSKFNLNQATADLQGTF
jgi:hypothetical protein